MSKLGRAQKPMREMTGSGKWAVKSNKGKHSVKPVVRLPLWDEGS